VDGTPVAVDDEHASLISKALQLSGFFPEFKAEHVRGVFPRSQMLSFPSDIRILLQGEPSHELYVICYGTLSIREESDGKSHELAVLSAGDTFGEIALLGGGPRTASVYCQEFGATLFKIPPEDMQYLLKENKPLFEHLKKLAFERLKR
jgi:CRP-like cAMP-binding protein